MVAGLSHITFIVRDLERTSGFFRKVFGAEEVYSSGDRMFSISREKFFLISGQWVCIMEGDTLTERTYNHVAFQIGEDEFDGYIQRILDTGAEIKPGLPRTKGEGRSIYFYDFDDHLFELHTGSLAERLKSYAKEGI
jgi:catechol 2,3-dioxygenase-like lactoylglutathione lyase family enzyme